MANDRVSIKARMIDGRLICGWVDSWYYTGGDTVVIVVTESERRVVKTSEMAWMQLGEEAN